MSSQEPQSSPGSERKSGSTILASQIESGVNELTRAADGLFLSGLSAGLDIGFGPLFMGVVLTLTADVWGEPLTTILVANMYAVGFVFVVLGRSELFTEHTTLAVLPVLDRRASLRQLLRLWGIVYAGNLVGGLVFAVGMVVFAVPYGIVDASAFADIGTQLVDHDWLVLLAAGVLAGWLMGLLSWLVAAAHDTISRVLFVWLVTASIGLAHLPHAIAGNVEVLAALFTTPAVTPVDWVAFQVLATVGNAVGGSVFVALLKYGHIVRGGE